jgi:phospholipid/cholesterol/gamma-HCH transport system ATP-binding protein
MAITVGEEILNLNERLNVTSIVVSHDRDLAFGVAERMAILHEGQIVALGTPAEIRANPDRLIQRFITAEFKANTV